MFVFNGSVRLMWLTFLHRCVANQHLCGKSCKFSGRHGCLDVCAKVRIFGLKGLDIDLTLTAKGN